MAPPACWPAVLARRPAVHKGSPWRRLPRRRLEEPLDGNALHDYAAVERLLTPRGGARPDLDPRAGLRSLFARSAEARRAGDPVPEEAIEALAMWGEAIEHVRAGLRRPRCDWQARFEDGAALATPDLVAAKCAAELMAISAQLEPDAAAAVRTGLEIVAWGEDLTRHGTLVGAMVGVAVKGVGVGSLESSCGGAPCHGARTRRWSRRSRRSIQST